MGPEKMRLVNPQILGMQYYTIYIYLAIVHLIFKE